MKKKKSETLEQQRYARAEFLRLKKMQQGVLPPDLKPSETALQPVGFKGKVQNYWYHYKWITLIAIFTAALLAVAVTQCATRVSPDLEIVIYSFQTVSDSSDALIEQYFEPFITDRNGDGKVKVQVLNCSFSEDSSNTQYQMTMRQKLQALIVADQSAMLFLTDEKGYENMRELGILSEESALLPQEFYTACTAADDPYAIALPSDLHLCLRKLDGTAFDGKEEATACYRLAQSVLTKLSADTRE